MRLCVIGAGAYGSALGKVLQENGHVAQFYDPFKYPDVTLDAALENAEAILLVAPSKEVPELLPKLPKNLPLISATKGILDPAVFNEFENFSILSGATFAIDLEERKPSNLTTNSPLVQKIFENHWLKINVTNDLKGIMLCGALKNVYAVYSGYKGLQDGTPEFEDFMAIVTSELAEILTQNSCDVKTLNESCGLADVRLTAGSDRSRNYRFGQRLATTANDPNDKITIEEILETTEGLSTILNLNHYGNFILPETAEIIRTVAKLINEKVIGVKNHE